ncbi:unnamed protein product [Notodromas monacha]|uniref:Uncharacterized protein n=1 Tax=Notodromas monacha TaxID=399045 RepID=A0A7R9GBC5_9CRUS|nr:unnamed protein product [Notodromas monacha]CAG0914679.1 unnamed protein product [Notodromas monacha]
MAGQELLYLHVFGEVTGIGRCGIYGLVDVPADKMPAEFWMEFPRSEPLHRQTSKAHQVLGRLGAWGFQLEAVVPVSSENATKLVTAGCFGPNVTYTNTYDEYGRQVKTATLCNTFCWILILRRSPPSAPVECRKNRQEQQKPVDSSSAEVLQTASAENVLKSKP